MPPVCGNITLEVEKKYSIYRDIAKSSNPHKSKIGGSTLDRIVGLNPAPYAVSNPVLLESVDELTIPSRTVEALHAINSYVDGYQDAQRTPKASNDNETANQVLSAGPYIRSRRFCLSTTIAYSPETNDSEGVK